jgi:hypothetical protein
LTLTSTSPALAVANCASVHSEVFRRPDADAVAALQAERHQAGGEIVDAPPSSPQLQRTFWCCTTSASRSR